MDIFNMKDIDRNGSFNASSIGYELFFKNGILVNYKSSDGLNKWSREWKISKISVFDSYYREAQYYLKEDVNAIIYEINEQADAFSKIPYGNLNEYIDFHKTKFGNVNYKMLMVAHYNEKIEITAEYQHKKQKINKFQMIFQRIFLNNFIDYLHLSQERTVRTRLPFLNRPHRMRK